MPRGRKKKVQVAADHAPQPDYKSSRLDSLYTQLATLLKKNKISKRDLASQLGMSYQGFLNSYNKKNLKLDTWMKVSDYLSIPFVARFETGRKAENEMDLTPSASATVSAGADDFTGLKLENAQDKIAILERQIASLESQLHDKQTIISLLGEKIR